MKFMFKVAVSAFVIAASAQVFAKSSTQRVFFIAPEDGATVTSPVKVKFGLEGMTIGKLGDMTPGTGHHHVIVNGSAMEKGKVIPADPKHIHFGAGQTEAEIQLEPGTYTLTMQFADGVHQSYGPEMSSTIKVTVAAGSKASSN